MTTPNPKPQPPTVAQQNARYLRERFPEDQLRDRISALEARDEELNRLREENERLSADLHRVVDRNSGLVSERDQARIQLAELREAKGWMVERFNETCEQLAERDRRIAEALTVADNWTPVPGEPGYRDLASAIRAALSGGSRTDRVARMLAEAQGLSDVPDWLREYVEEGMLPAKDSAT